MLASVRKLTTAVGALAAVLAVSATAYAAEITHTSFGVGGGFTVPSGEDLGDTNSITIINDGQVVVTSADPYQLSGLVTLGEMGTMQSINSISSFTSISNYLVLASGVVLDLNTLSLISQSGGPPGYINLSGTGVLSAPGFDATAGVFSFTGTTTDNLTFSFGVETSAEQSGVPEPFTLTLLGLGLTGLGFRRRRLAS